MRLQRDPGRRTEVWVRVRVEPICNCPYVMLSQATLVLVDNLKYTFE